MYLLWTFEDFFSMVPLAMLVIALAGSAGGLVALLFEAAFRRGFDG